MLFLAIVSVIFTAWLFISVAKQKTSFFSDAEVQEFTGSFTVTYGEEAPIEVEAPFMFRGKKNQTATLSRVLHEGDFPSLNFMVYAWSSYHRVTLDDEILYEFHEDKAIPNMPPSSGWIFVRLPQDYAGRELRLEITPQVLNYEHFEIEFLSGTKASLIYYIVQSAKYSFLLSFIFFIFGIFIFIASFLIKQSSIHTRSMLLGLVCICAGAWIFSESGSSQLFFDNRFFISALCSTSFFLLPVVSTALMMTYQDFQDYKPLKVIFILFSALFVFMLITNTFGIISWLNLVFILHILVLSTFITIACKYWSLRHNRKKPHDFSLIHGFAIFAVFITLDIVAYLFDRGKSLFYSRIGLFFLFITLFFNIVQLIQKAHEEEIYERLAYEDLMTGCKNRTAFEERKSELKTQYKDAQLILFLSDMNDLKSINDVYGHAQGDYAIKSYAAYLKETFSDYEVYRIGGDEFCVIALNCTADTFRQLAEMLDNKVKNAPEPNCSMRAAYSYHETTGAEIENMFRSVDKEMYMSKKKLKDEKSVSQ